MDPEIKQAIKNLLKEVDLLAGSKRNISMERFKDYHIIKTLRDLVELEEAKEAHHAVTGL